MRHILVVLAMILGIAGHAGAAEPIPPPTTLNPSSDSHAKHGMTKRGRESLLDRKRLPTPFLPFVLSWKPSFVDGYVVRAVSAAEMGATRQAKHDLDIARQLDPQDKLKAIGNFRERIETALGAVPKEPAAQLHADLLKSSRDGKSMDQLAEKAVKLLKSSNAERRFGDETYSETKRQLMWAAGAHPATKRGRESFWDRKRLPTPFLPARSQRVRHSISQGRRTRPQAILGLPSEHDYRRNGTQSCA